MHVNCTAYIVVIFVSIVTCFFFFQAEDGIRDYKVTGVQTCALPISASLAESPVPSTDAALVARHVHEHGYGALPVFVRESALANLNATIDEVVAAGWPAVFAFVFDGAWSAVRTATVVSVLEHTVGGARQ